MPLPQRRVKRTRRGGFELNLPPEEREVLRSLPAQLREILPSEDPAVGRLFPPAYPHDPDNSAEFLRLVRDDLLAGHVEALDLCQGVQDLLGDPVREVLLILPRAHVREWEHGDRG